MNRKIIIIASILGVVLIGALAYAGARTWGWFDREPQNVTSTNGGNTNTNTNTNGGETPTPTPTSFDRTGNLVRNNPGMKEGVWYLVYEEAGRPAVSVELAFTASSVCKTAQGTTFTCDGQFQSGQRARVQGAVSSQVVTVANLSLEAMATNDLIRVTTPTANATVKSPLQVTGQARGTWYFEASFPVKLLDANGKVLAQAPAQAQGEWMTENFVPFSVTLTFSVPTTPTGTLVLEKDNPSGLPQFDNELRIPMKFETQKTSVKLYYYDANKDKDAAGNILCSAKGLVAVNREIPKTTTPIQDAVKELLRGDLTAAERAQGVTTEFPLPGVSLKGAALKNGVLTLEFNDPQNKTGGGSCRVAILWAQIEATAKQFPGVTSVKFIPEELFQP